jgi:integrase
LIRYAGRGHDSVRISTRREYRRLLVNFALTYFDREVRVRELDRVALQQFVDWLTTRPGRDGRLCDSSIANALTPLRLTLNAAVADGLLDANPAGQVVLPRRRSGRAWGTRERRCLTRAELVRLLDEVPIKWRPLFELLAATGLRVSEATGLRWSDLVLDGPTPHLRVKRAGCHRRTEVPSWRAADPTDARAGRVVVRVPPASGGRGRVRVPRGATAARQIRAACAGGYSSPPPSVPDSMASAFTLSATRAHRCSSSPV